MKGSTCGIVTHPPTEDDNHKRQNIILSDEFDWDPSKNLFEMSSTEEGIGQVQIFIDTSILLRLDSHAHLQRYIVEMNW